MPCERAWALLFVSFESTGNAANHAAKPRKHKTN